MTEGEAKPEVQETILRPEAAEAAIGILADFYTDLYQMSEGADRATTSTIAYVDRMILLAGGTLTLIFTVVGSIQHAPSDESPVGSASVAHHHHVLASGAVDSVRARLQQHVDQETASGRDRGCNQQGRNQNANAYPWKDRHHEAGRN